MGAKPFNFEPDGRRRLIDRANGLRLSLHQWPEYNFSVSVEPSSGLQSEAWPLSKRAYFEFGLGSDLYENWNEALGIKFALAHVSFERDYPGRTDELLDAILPLVGQLYNHDHSSSRDLAPIPHQLRPLLKQKGRYFSSRDD